MPWEALCKEGWNPAPPLALSEVRQGATHAEALPLAETIVAYIRPPKGIKVLAGRWFLSEVDVLGFAGDGLAPKVDLLIRLAVQGGVLHHGSALARKLRRWPLSLGNVLLLRSRGSGSVGIVTRLLTDDSKPSHLHSFGKTPHFTLQKAFSYIMRNAMSGPKQSWNAPYAGRSTTEQRS